MTERVNGEVRTLRGSLDASGLRFGIVAASFNDFVVDRLLDAAIAALVERGASSADILVVRVPGAFELPLAAQRLAEGGRHDALIALGCVIRGETPHFDYVAAEASRGLTDVSLRFGIPIGFGVLTTADVEQAMERAGGKAGNKGVDAALAALELATLLNRMER